MGPQQARSQVLVILGPTASGKTPVAIELARHVNGEVISADSRAFFAGLDIVTAKPTLSEQAGIPHHLIDCVPISGNYDAMAFRSDVERLLPEIRTRHRNPIIAGGGTLYLGAILRGLFEGPEKDETLRTSLKMRTSNDLHRKLMSVDPTAAARIHPNDRLRVIRALEVTITTGKPMSEWQAEAKALPEDFLVVGLCREREQHRLAIEDRIHSMLELGLIDEVDRLRSAGLTPEVQAYRTIGVPEAFDVLDGKITREEFLHIVTARTWQLVRRQMAWFRRDKDVRWIDVSHSTSPEVVDQILAPSFATANDFEGSP
jgi:tRNA dimethylallyltransferase